MTYNYNIELDVPLNKGRHIKQKYVTLEFKNKLEKGQHYIGSNKEMGKFGFTVYREVKPFDISYDDICNMYVTIEGADENSDIARLQRKLFKTFYDGKMVSITKRDALDFLDYVAYDSRIFKSQTTDVKELAVKLDKKFKLGVFNDAFFDDRY